jgi:Raf kinase inhibitor-like YbhB/YbcL family protein
MIQLFVFILMTVTAGTTLSVKSTAFANRHYIPTKYTCEGLNHNPSLVVSKVPVAAKSLALIMDDPDSPNGPFDHWIMWNIPVNAKIEEKSAPGVEGLNSRQQNKYIGPCPPTGIHEYHFRVYALDIHLDLPTNSSKTELLAAMQGHILASGELIGLYKKKAD